MVSNNEYLFNSTSNGLAAGPSYTQAILSGLLEVIERDAFLITWLCKLPMPKVRLDSIKSKHTQNIIQMYQRRGIEIHINALILDTCIPTFLATAMDLSDNGPAVTVGLSSDVDSEMGIFKALQEIGQIRPHLKQAMRSSFQLADISQVSSLLDNVKNTLDNYRSSLKGPN